MKLNRKLRLQLLLQNGLFVVLLLGLAAGIAWVTRDVKVQWDLTQSQRNTLSQASAEVLKQMAGPIAVTAYATTQDTEGDVRRLPVFPVTYQRAKTDSFVVFVWIPRAAAERRMRGGSQTNELVI